MRTAVPTITGKLFADCGLEFAHGKVDPHQAGQVGGHAGTSCTTSSSSSEAPSNSGKYKPVEHGGLKADGGKDKRVGTHGTFFMTINHLR